MIIIKIVTYYTSGRVNWHLKYRTDVKVDTTEIDP